MCQSIPATFSAVLTSLFPFLSLSVSQAEARLAAKRAARAEAREIRMKELERQQKEVQVKMHSYILNMNTRYAVWVTVKDIITMTLWHMLVESFVQVSHRVYSFFGTSLKLKHKHLKVIILLTFVTPGSILCHMACLCMTLQQEDFRTLVGPLLTLWTWSISCQHCFTVLSWDS